MPQLLLIAKASMAEDGRQEDDIINIYPDDWVFSEHEKKIFKIVKTTTKKEALEAAIPKTFKYGDPVMSFKRVAWQTPEGDWKEILKKPRFEVRWEDNKVKENYSKEAQNISQDVVGIEIG